MKRMRAAFLFFLVLSLCVLPVACGSSDPSTSSGQADDDDDDQTDNDDQADDDQTDDDALDDDATPERADIVLPEYPFWPNDAFTVDEDFMEDLATLYCAAQGDAATAQEFFMGALPMESFDLMFADEPPAAPSTLMGNMYVSGYFGGLWLRNALFPNWPEFDVGYGYLRLPFNLLARPGAAQTAVAQNASDAEAVAAARKQVFMLLALYGYNLGYLEKIIEEPPAGVAPPTDKLVCQEGQLLDCNSPDLPWAFLRRYADAIDSLREPPNEAWTDFATMTENAEMFVAQGRLAWTFIPLDNLTPEAYALLIDLSVYFLMASKAAVLGAMTAWADALPPDGRYALLVSGGMISWGGSYFLGLMTLSATDEFPLLTCPE